MPVTKLTPIKKQQINKQKITDSSTRYPFPGNSYYLPGTW